MANYAKKLEIWINCKYLDKSDMENCRFNGKPCEKIRDLDKLHKPCNNRRQTISHIKILCAK